MGSALGERRSELAYTDSYGEAEDQDHLAAAVQKRLLRFGPTVEVVLFAIVAGQLSLLLAQRAERPEEGKWALPGDFVALGAGFSGYGEGLEEAADRVLAKTGLGIPRGYLEQLRTYGDPKRHPLVRAFSIAYLATTPKPPVLPSGADQAGTRFFAVRDLERAKAPRVAFDHYAIVVDALERVRGKLEWEGGLAVSFLDEPFTIPGLRRVYEAVWGGPVHRGDFGRKVRSVEGFLVPTGEYDSKTGGPRATLYRLGPNTRFRPPMTREAMFVTKPP